MIYRIILDGENRFEEVYFNEYTKENAIKARHLITEKYAGHKVGFAEPLEYDLEIFRIGKRYYDLAKDIIITFENIGNGNDTFVNGIMKLMKFSVITSASPTLREPPEHLSYKHPKDSAADKRWHDIRELSFNSHPLPIVGDILFGILISISDLIYDYERGCIVSIINCKPDSQYISGEIDNIIDAICKEIGHHVEDRQEWVEDDSDDSLYSITEWR